MGETATASYACEKLLLFSDIEGCVDTFGIIKQHTFVCDSATFSAIYNFLSTSRGNHVAFCGDYFDHGSKIAASIIGIAWLLGEFPEQVHIILGNRDINKMRLKYEELLVGNASIDEIMKVNGIFEPWQNNWINSLIDTFKKGDAYPTDSVQRVEKLLGPTFGAGKLLTNLSIELKIDSRAALFLFKQIFTGPATGDVIPKSSTMPDITVSNFVKACKSIFFYGKLIELIKIGEKNVLLSHAGSAHLVIYTQDYSKEIARVMQQSSNVFTVSEYFQELEYYRYNLECDNEGNRNKTKEKLYNVDELLPISTVITNINNLKSRAYTDILAQPASPSTTSSASPSTTSSASPSVTVSHAWLLIQAMGIGGQRVATPIQSCILKPNCNALIEPLSEKTRSYFSSPIGKVDITAHGHIPSCLTVPVIARISMSPNIIFVALDQSNGNRPKVDNMKLENMPIACIADTYVGVVSLQHNGNLHMADEKIRDTYGDTYIIYAYEKELKNNDPDYHRDFVKQYMYTDMDKIPSYEFINTLIDTSDRFKSMKIYSTPFIEKQRLAQLRIDTPSASKPDTRERDESEAKDNPDAKDEPDSDVNMGDAPKGGNKNKSKNKRLRKCRKCLMCCNGSCDYSAKLTNTKRGIRKQKKARKTIKKSNNSKQRTRKQKKARKYKK